MLDSMSPAGLACAALVGLAVLLAVRDRPRALRRVSARQAPLAPRGAPRIRALAGRADAPSLLRRVVLSVLAGGSVCLAGWRLGGGPGLFSWLALPPLVAVGVLTLGRLEPLAARRRRQQLVLHTPQALELLAACLAAGMPVRTACSAVVDAFDGAVADDLGRVMSATALGVSDAEAWRSLRDHPQLGPAAVDLARSVESGTMMVQRLHHHAQVARERRRGALQVRARAVGVRSVLPLMICFIPSFMLLGVVPTVASAVSHALS